MKEIPILFSTPMVKAILEGRKTQTRRIMMPQIEPCNHSFAVDADWKDMPTTWSTEALKYGLAYCALCGNGTGYKNDFAGIRCPYGRPGDLLWVRETWRHEMGFIGELPQKQPVGYIYKSDYNKEGDKWKPSIHMPKEAARIWLKVESVHVERLQDISEEDAIAEGVQFTDFGKDQFNQQQRGYHVLPVTSHEQCLATAQTAYGNLWDKINGVGSWDSNPWLWVITFRALSTTGKPSLITT